MLTPIEKAYLGDIKPSEDYYICGIKGNTYLTSFSLQNLTILGEVIDILSENNNEKIAQYREQGYWYLRLEKGRVAIIKPFSLYEAIEIKQKILRNKL